MLALRRVRILVSSFIPSRLGRTSHFLSTSSTSSWRFPPSQLDGVESLEDYHPTGLHPIILGQNVAHGRYRIIHKLGHGGSSTVWLARSSASGKLVTLKVMRARVLDNPDTPEISFPWKVLENIQVTSPTTTRSNIQVVDDHFIEDGPNGSHLCLVTRFAGPSIYSMLECSGRVNGSRRLRRDLAIQVAKRLACAVQHIHAAGCVHGDITTSNVLFQFTDEVENWSDDFVYNYFGHPNTEDTSLRTKVPPSPHIPIHIVEPIESKYLTNPNILREDVLLIDFDQSFSISSPPPEYNPATVPHYTPPEALFEGEIGKAADVWGLACTIFEIRTGLPLFDSFFGGDDRVMKEMVATLGKLPDPWWSAFENRRMWFDDNGRPKARDLQRVLVPAETSIEHKLASIGAQDEPPSSGTDKLMMEPLGTRLEKAEVDLLADLLRKMLRYRPEDRINMNEVVSHPWFALEN